MTTPVNACPRCGAEVPPGGSVCPSCGLALGPTATGQQASPHQPPPPPYAPSAWSIEPIQPVDPADQRRKRLVALAVGMVVALVVGLGVGYLFLRDGDDGTLQVADGTGSSAGTDGSSTSAAVQDPPASTPAATSSGPSASPAETPYWTVVVSSKTVQEGGLDAARVVAEQLLGAGYESDIFQSEAHSSLNPGYWVTATGRLQDAESARTLANQLKSAGFDTAYQRCVGTADECA